MQRTELEYNFGHHDILLDRKLQQHIARTDNPHMVTKAQVGLGKVEDIAPENMPLSKPQREYVNTFVKDVEIDQNFTTGEVKVKALDADGNTISSHKIIVPGAEGIWAERDSEGNVIVDTYASRIVVKVEENKSYACLISPSGDEISRIPICDAVSITRMVFDSETYTLKLIKSDDSEITCTLSEIYNNLKAYIDTEIKKVYDKLSGEVSRATDKESQLESAINIERERAQLAENTKVDKSVYEAKIEELSQADSRLAKDLEDEVTARETLESDLDTFKGTVYTKTETDTKIAEHHDSSKQDKIDEDHKLPADLIDGIIIPEVPVKSISVNGTDVPADEDKNVDISVPTKTSDLQKDDVYTKDETDSKCSDTLTEAKNYADSKIPEVTVKYEVISDVGEVEKNIESGVRYMFTAKNGLVKIDLLLPDHVPAGFISEITFRGDAFGSQESEDCVNIITNLPVKYTQFARTVTKPENSHNAYITYLLEYNGVYMTCYVTELQDSPTDR